MQNEIEEFSKNWKPNEVLKIMFEKSDLSFEERLTAVYLRALKPDYFEHFKPIEKPSPPFGWTEDYVRFNSLSQEKKVEGWRNLRTKYAGYFKAVEDAELQTESNLKFLKQMESHFEKMGLLKQAEICKQRIHEFEN